MNISALEKLFPKLTIVTEYPWGGLDIEIESLGKFRITKEKVLQFDACMLFETEQSKAIFELLKSAD
ncbi:hypothetical protein [Proteus phage 2207-N35]|nr:hypothetical protein [Proteus phage 2207-N35]